MSLRTVNLNLLPMLQALLRERSVSAAAESMGLTQPAMSAALARLRIALADPLLVKVGRHMELTSRARALIVPVENACEAMQQVWLDRAFEPASAQRGFVIASADHGPMVIAPPLIVMLAERAPGISVQFVDFALDHLHRSRDRRIDLMIAPDSVFAAVDHDELEIVQLTGHEEFVWVIGPRHPLAGNAVIRPEDLANDRFVSFHPGSTRAGDLSDAISGQRSGQRAIARFQQFTILPIVASLTDTVAIVPASVARAIAAVCTLRIVAMPEPKIHTNLCLAWSPVHSSDPAHRWLREALLAHFAGPGTACAD